MRGRLGALAVHPPAFPCGRLSRFDRVGCVAAPPVSSSPNLALPRSLSGRWVSDGRKAFQPLSPGRSAASGVTRTTLLLQSSNSSWLRNSRSRPGRPCDADRCCGGVGAPPQRCVMACRDLCGHPFQQSLHLLGTGRSGAWVPDRWHHRHDGPLLRPSVAPDAGGVPPLPAPTPEPSFMCADNFGGFCLETFYVCSLAIHDWWIP